jgi:Glycosyltransferase family 87
MPMTSSAFAVGVVLFWSILAGVYFGGHDALTYLAAGERLNAGHMLYALSPGDRLVETAPPFYGPLLSPPLIAVVFRPLALVGLPAMWTWTLVLGLMVAAAVSLLVRTWSAASLVFVLGIGLGMAAISGNVSNLFIPAYVALWRWRARPIVGALVGIMAVTKLLPLVFVGFLLAGRRHRALGWCIIGAAGALVVTVAGAGVDNTVAYLAVARGAAPQPTSLPYLLGLPWLSPLLLAAGTLGASFLKERPAFVLCVLTIVFGAPLLTWRELATLVVLIAPSALAAPPAQGERGIGS